MRKCSGLEIRISEPGANIFWPNSAGSCAWSIFLWQTRSQWAALGAQICTFTPSYFQAWKCYLSLCLSKSLMKWNLAPGGMDCRPMVWFLGFLKLHIFEMPFHFECSKADFGLMHGSRYKGKYQLVLLLPTSGVKSLLVII